MALDFKCVFGNWVDRGSTRVNDWPKRHCKLASILPVFTGFQSLTPLLRKVRSFHLPGFSVVAAWRCWCASRLARLLANISGACCVRRLWWQQRLSARREPCDLCDFGRCRLWPAGGGGARGTAGHSGVCWQCSAVACLWVRRGGGGIWDSPSYPFRRHPSVVRRSPFFAVRRRRRSPSSLGERGIGGGEEEAAGWSAASAHLLAGVSSRRIGSVDSGTMSPSTTPQPRFSARPPQGASCQVRLVQAWMAVFFLS